MANLATMAGHVVIEDQAVIGGLAGIHQFVRIGRMAMVGGFAKVMKDIPPYSIVDGQPARIYGINSRGMIRRRIPKETRLEIKRAYHIICEGTGLSKAIEEIRASMKPSVEMEHLLRFLGTPSKMGVLIKSARKPGKRGTREIDPEELEFS
jgi:UDP-N-acetylglucosamine acyltransferase